MTYSLVIDIFQKQPLELLYKKAVLKNFLIFTGKHLSWRLFLIKLHAFLELYLRETQTWAFSCEYCKTFKNTYLEEDLQNTAFNHYSSLKSFLSLMILGLIFQTALLKVQSTSRSFR